MQLKNKPSIRQALATASCALLATQPLIAAESGDWVINLGTLFYDEKDRVSIVEPIAIVTYNYDDEDYVSLRLVNDTMTGASHNGASISSQSQTIPTHTTTSASGSAGPGTDTVVSPFAIPLSDFSDQRNAVGIDWQKAHSRTFRTIIGGNASVENDYNSFGSSVTFQRDTDDKLTTFTLGLALSIDAVKPGGGTPKPLAVLSSSDVNSRDDDDDDDEEDDHDDEDAADAAEHKLLTDVLVGITQVVSRNVLTQLNYSIGQSRGYLTDPYKIISRVDPTSGVTVDYLTEKRPDNRLRQAFYWKAAIHLPKDVVHLSYRYYWDDWSITAHTAEIKYYFNMGDHFYLMPSFRYYKQSGAKFFKYSLLNDQSLPDYASADLRLAPLQSTTRGLKIGYNFGRNTEVSFRAEYMQQWGEKNPSEAVGLQRQLDLFPNLEVTMYTVEISMDF